MGYPSQVRHIPLLPSISSGWNLTLTLSLRRDLQILGTTPRVCTSRAPSRPKTFAGSTRLVTERRPRHRVPFHRRSGLGGSPCTVSRHPGRTNLRSRIRWSWYSCGHGRRTRSSLLSKPPRCILFEARPHLRHTRACFYPSCNILYVLPMSFRVDSRARTADVPSLAMGSITKRRQYPPIAPSAITNNINNPRRSILATRDVTICDAGR